VDDGLAFPHHDGSEMYISDPSPELGDVVAVRVLVPPGFECRRVWVRTTPDGEPYFDEATIDASNNRGTWWLAHLRAHNPVTSYRFALEGGPCGHRWLNGAGVFTHDVPDIDDFRLTTFPSPPGWLADRVAYEIFVDRFATSGAVREWPAWAAVSSWGDPIDLGRPAQQLYGGDLPGIERRLDHIAAVGANLLYLTPFFPAESSHRYDASTFDHVDPLLGGDAALVSLAEAAHRRGMRVIGDITANHSGGTHEWFGAARVRADSIEAGFYLFREHPDDYESWSNVRTLPKFDLRNGELRRRLFEGPSSVVGRFLGAGVGLDGWRVDVANMAGRLGDVDVNRDVAKAMRRTMDEVRADAYLVAEHLYDAHADLLGDGWHGTMSYAGFTEPVWRWLGGPDASRIRFVKPLGIHALPGRLMAATMRSFSAIVPWRTLTANLNLLDSHDTARFRTIAGSRERMIAGLGLLMAWPGVPMIFAGDEVGVEGVDANRARAPMPWDRARWDSALLEAVRRLIGVRRSSHALQHGGLRWVHVGDDVVVLLRESVTERVLVQVSRADHSPVSVDRDALSVHGRIGPLFGDAELVVDGPAVAMPTDGPAVHIWRLDP
jgi:alpha-glucosidase